MDEQRAREPNVFLRHRPRCGIAELGGRAPGAAARVAVKRRSGSGRSRPTTGRPWPCIAPAVGGAMRLLHQIETRGCSSVTGRARRRGDRAGPGSRLAAHLRARSTPGPAPPRGPSPHATLPPRSPASSSSCYRRGGGGGDAAAPARGRLKTDSWRRRRTSCARRWRRRCWWTACWTTPSGRAQDARLPPAIAAENPTDPAGGRVFTFARLDRGVMRVELGQIDPRPSSRSGRQVARASSIPPRCGWTCRKGCRRCWPTPTRPQRAVNLIDNAPHRGGPHRRRPWPMATPMCASK